MLMEATVVQSAILAAAEAQVRARADRQGGILFSQVGGRYARLVEAGQVFFAANQAAAALSLLNATATGFILTNPVGSGVRVVLLDVTVALATAPAAIASLALAAGLWSATAVVQTTPLTVRNAQIGPSAPTAFGLAASAATLPAAPVAIRAIGGGPVATGSVTAPFIRDEVAGMVQLQPGTSLSLSAFTTAISVLASMYWAELPL